MLQLDLQKENGKSIVILRRVSSESQNLAMQESKDEHIRANLSETDYIILNELRVSANKIPLFERTQMIKLIQMIKVGEVSTICVYDRSRLVRDFFQHMYLVDLFAKYNVKVIFTTDDKSYTPYSRDKTVEGILAMIGDEEGNNIARRTKDARLKCSASKFGYERKNKVELIYRKNSRYEPLLTKLFEFAKTCKEQQALLEGIDRIRKESKKSIMDMLKILSDPFYAGLYKAGSQFYPLNNIEKYIDEDDFIELFTRISKIIEQLEFKERESRRQQIIHPYSYRCKNPMKFYATSALKQSKYQCQKASCRVSIAQHDFNKDLIEHIHHVMRHCDQEKCYDLMRRLVKNTLNSKLKTQKETMITIEKLQQKLVLNYRTKLASQVIEQIEKLRTTNATIEKEIHKLEIYRQSQFKLKIWSFDVSKMLMTEISQIAKVLIGKVYVDRDSIYFQSFLNTYLNSMNETGGIDIEV